MAGISQKDLPVLVPLLCGVGLVAVGIYLCLVYFLICRKNRDTSTETYMQWVQHSKIAVVLVNSVGALVLYIGAKVLTAENPLLKLQGNTLWGFVCGSGLFLLPIAWVVGVIRPKTYLETPKHLVILVAACYCVVVYAAFLRTEVEFYYYYGRYLAPFMPIAAVFAALTLDKLRARVTLPVMTACLLFVSPFDYFLATHQDDTRMTWSVLEDLSNEINSDDCVIVGDDDMWTLYLTLRATTGAAMYPEMEDPETQAAELAGQYDHVYYLGNGKWNDSFEHQFQQVYTNTITQSTDGKLQQYPADASSCSRCPIRKSAIRFPCMRTGAKNRTCPIRQAPVPIRHIMGSIRWKGTSAGRAARMLPCSVTCKSGITI